MADLEPRQRTVALMRGVVARDLGDLLATRPAWMRDGLCREYPTVNFIPGKGQPSRQPLAICSRCAVAPECLAFALEHDEVGVWGATTTKDRQAMQRKLAG